MKRIILITIILFSTTASFTQGFFNVGTGVGINYYFLNGYDLAISAPFEVHTGYRFEDQKIDVGIVFQSNFYKPHFWFYDPYTNEKRVHETFNENNLLIQADYKLNSKSSVGLMVGTMIIPNRKIYYYKDNEEFSYDTEDYSFTWEIGVTGSYYLNKRLYTKAQALVFRRKFESNDQPYQFYDIDLSIFFGVHLNSDDY